MTELDDDREGIARQALDEDAGDPAAAFDALRRTIETQGAQIGAEMTVMRRGLEAAFDQLEKIEPAQDYKPQLAQLVQALDTVAERMHGVEQSPILRQGATHYAALLERSGEALIRTAAQQLERQASDLERAGRNLSAHVAGARERSRQDWWLVAAFAVGLLAGALVGPSALLGHRYTVGLNVPAQAVFGSPDRRRERPECWGKRTLVREWLDAIGVTDVLLRFGFR